MRSVLDNLEKYDLKSSYYINKTVLVDKNRDTDTDSDNEKDEDNVISKYTFSQDDKRPKNTEYRTELLSDNMVVNTSRAKKNIKKTKKSQQLPKRTLKSQQIPEVPKNQNFSLNSDDNEIISTFMIECLNKEYAKYSSIIFDLETHIETLVTLRIIDHNSRNCYLKILNNTIKLLNITYNENLKNLDLVNGCNLQIGTKTNTNTLTDNVYTRNFNIQLLNHYKAFGDNVYNYIYDLLNVYQNTYSYQESLNVDSIDNFYNVMNVILKDICSKVGFNSIKNACELLGLTEEYNTEIFNLYNKIFVPLNFSYVEDTTHIFDIKLTTSTLKYDMLNEYGKLYLRHKSNNYYVFDGYFKIDSLNTIRKTCQINYPSLYDKITTVEILLDNSGIPEIFYKNYIKNSSIVCILINDAMASAKYIAEQYDTYNNIHNMTLTELIEYIESIDESNIDKFYNTVKLILLKSQIVGFDTQNKINKDIVDTDNTCINTDNINADNQLSVAQSLNGRTTLSEFIVPMFEAIKLNSNFYDKDILEVLYKYFSFDQQLKLNNLLIKDSCNLGLTNSANNNEENDIMKRKIKEHKYMPQKVKKCAMEKIKEMKQGNSNEYYKQSLFVKTLLNFPWPTPYDDQVFTKLKTHDSMREYLDDVSKKLDNIIYGHTESKKSIVELIGKWICNPNSAGYSFGLCGPPGIGKTLFAKAIGKAMGIPFVQITLGGQNDGELLHGHGYTYTSSQPGLIIKKMNEAGNSRCIMYFDELDKACKKHDSNEIFNILVHLTDPNTNMQFQDRFFQEINFPLNKVLFIFSYNNDKLIDNILMDRIKQLEIKPYKIHDKRQIVKQFIIPEMCDSFKIAADTIKIEDNEINYIIESYTREPGVRDLKREFERIFLKLNIDKIYSANLFSDQTKNVDKIILTNKVIKEYLGESRNEIEIVHTNDAIGVINGLYATESGIGGILPIEVYYNKIGSEVTINLTGSQKRVMRESVKTAYTVATNIINHTKLADYHSINPYGLHIHTPSCAVPKDGPSAGAAFTIAIVSRILSKKIARDIAITGEINLRGNITKIGALDYKLNGAKKAGIKLVLISEENKEDLNNIIKDDTTLIDENFRVIVVSGIMDALRYTLTDFDASDFSV